MKDIDWLLNLPIAHRGFHSSEIPENSMAAFSEAIKHGFSIELDVRKTKDDILIVFHDDIWIKFVCIYNFSSSNYCLGGP